MSKTLDDFTGFTMMDPTERTQLLEGQVDILTDKVAEESEYLSTLPCPKCGTTHCLPTVDARKPFVDGQILPRRLMHCLNCGLEFEPYTGIQTNVGGVPKGDAQLSKMFLGNYEDILQ